MSKSKSRAGRDLTNLSRSLAQAAPDPFMALMNVPVRPIQTRIFHDEKTVLQIRDGRTFDPTWSVRPAGSVRRGDARLQIARSERFSSHIAFQRPAFVAPCVRRKKRREVIHALRISGRRGVGRGKRRHTTFWSSVKC